VNWLGRHAGVVDHLAVKNVAQGAPLGGGSTSHWPERVPILQKCILEKHPTTLF